MNEEKDTKKRIDFSKVQTWLFMAFIFYILLFVFSMKILGAGELPKEVEKKGYCKLKYGEDWNYNKKTFTCWSKKVIEPILIKDFETICPDQKIFSSGFNSYCFNLGREW